MSQNLESLFSLEGKVVVITGAAGLLGRKHAEAISAYGGNPVLLDLSDAAVNKLADQLNEQFGVDAYGFAVDITNEQAIAKNTDVLMAHFGKIDCLVNNAANNPKVEDSSEKSFSRLEHLPLDVWDQDVAVGLTGAFLCAKHYGYKIAQNKDGGSIVNICSDLGLMAPDQRLYTQTGLTEAQQPVKPVTYSVVKTGLIGLTRYLATYWAEKNVRCNAMCLGGVENGQPEAFLAKLNSRIPMNRLAQSDEYQGTLVWMLSQASSYLNGAIVPIEGGRTCW